MDTTTITVAVICGVVLAISVVIELIIRAWLYWRSKRSQKNVTVATAHPLAGPDHTSGQDLLSEPLRESVET